MAEEVEMTPVEMTPVEMTPVASEPPVSNPLPKPPAAGGTVSALRPGLKLPPKPGSTVSALKPGLKLPPKPGVATSGATASALRPGLKLPPKPGVSMSGATASALRPGLKLPPKPGATVSALKSNLKLPPKPAVPQIRKPGAMPTVKPLPRPVMAPAAASPAPAENAAAPAPTPAPVAAPQAAPQKPIEALKGATQKLKGVTQPIPQQAILHKTGIIAETSVTDAQKEAAKHKTSRISLSDAMGAAPVKNENAPMKTIRIKRPSDIVGATERLKPQPPAASPAPQSTAVPPPAATPAENAPAAPENAPANASASVGITQRKTLKITRPGAIKPGGKFTVKKPTAAASPAPSATPADNGGVPEIKDISPMPPPAPVAVASDKATPASVLCLLVKVAACVIIAVVAYFLFENTQTNYF